MLGAIAGDIIGSPYEFDNHRSTEFPLFTEHSEFTDDTILTVAVADCLMHDRDLADAFHEAYQRYPHVSWGSRFGDWAARARRDAYGSWGNGSAMRVSACGWYFNTECEVLEAAEWSAAVTHNHRAGIRGAQSVALAIWMAREGATKADIVAATGKPYSFEPTHTVAELQVHYLFDESCQGTLPAVLQVFDESESFEHAIRLAVSIGGDSDTIAAIVGSIAEAYYGGVPEAIATEALKRLDEHLLPTVQAFRTRYLT